MVAFSYPIFFFESALEKLRARVQLLSVLLEQRKAAAKARKVRRAEIVKNGRRIRDILA